MGACNLAGGGCAARFIWPGNSLLFLQLAEFRDYLLVVRLLAQLVDPAEGDPALLIHDENGALVDPGQGVAFAHDPELLSDAAMGPVVAGQGVFLPADGLLLPSDMAIDGIGANAHDLGIVAGELGEITAERRHFLSSGRAPIERVKRHHQVLFAFQVAGLERLPLLAGDSRKFEVRCQSASLQSRHSHPPIRIAKAAPPGRHGLPEAKHSFYRGQKI